MKKWCLFFSLSLCLCLLSACATTPAAGGPRPGTPPPATEEDPTDKTAEATLICRIVEEDDGSLLLAEQNGGGSAVYTLRDTTAEYEEGMLVEIGHGGMTFETFPAQFADVAYVRILPDGFDDLCQLYLDVLDDLWDVDEGLNSDITELGVDLSKTRLSESERAAVAWAFGQEHGIAPIQGTYEELVEQGYITAGTLEGGGKFYQWETGCLFSITEQEVEGGSEKSLTFDAEKWRSGTGAYYFVDCTAKQSAGGAWGDYTVGSQAIS